MNKLAFSNEDLAWADRITTAWRKTIEAIFAVGDLLLEAKVDLPHGSFEKMCRFSLPFGERTAQYLMLIAQDKRLRNPKHASLLPHHWTTLNALHDLTDVEFDAAIERGKINPEMTRADAEALAINYKKAKEAEFAAVAVRVTPIDTPVVRVLHDGGEDDKIVALRPPEEEADHQGILYDRACLLFEEMTAKTRAKFLAHLREKYGSS
jgi:hypothetical protein